MPSFEIRFSHDFKSGVSGESRDGPQFHRYLPSRNDGAIVHNVDRPAGTCRIWFARNGQITADGWISQNYQGQPLDKAIVNLQAVLTAGPVFGSFVMEAVDQALVDELRLRKFGAPVGMAFAQQFVRAVINPCFVRTVASIRLLTGQYWLEPLFPWDGSKETLGIFCQHLQMRWRENDTEFDHFLPAAPDYRFEPKTIENPYDQLPDESRWTQIVQIIESGYEPSIVAETLLRAHQLRQQGETRLAFVEAVSALEIATTEIIRRTLGANKVVLEAAQSYGALPFKAKLAIVTSFCGIEPSDIELCLRGYAIRNGLAHEGASDSPDDRDALAALLKVGRLLCSEPRPIFATQVNSNEKRKTLDEWIDNPGPKYFVQFGSSRSSPPGFEDWVDPDAKTTD